ncbi:thiamine phosphate synthase [Thauera linaloolentis]|uniref:thiamine phosphate synthase n=1 Tax=Thauera linaloolentis TaxID=76112 RepID=UPI0006842686|nr:thiamine phosphate synthase [Thauera linaloolentis]MCM8564362.1 thiamine phosphate synthase [Thauera linaloolentis]
MSEGEASSGRVANAGSALRGLYAVTPDERDDARLAALAEQVLSARPALLQYRNKLAGPQQRRAQAGALLRLCRAARVPLIINDDLALALEIGADGLHLGRGDGDPAAARRALGAGRILGVTCYADWERARAGAEAGADYVAFGAMFPSSTKPGAPPAPFALLGRAKAELRLPVAAIGGITLDNAAEVIAAGADLIAVVSDVFAAPDPAMRATAYRALFQRPPRRALVPQMPDAAP